MPGPAVTRDRMSTRGRLVRSLVAPFLLALFLGLVPGGASAHSQVISTDPVDGARLPASPERVSVTFNENVGLATGGLRVIRPDGSLASMSDGSVAGPTVSVAVAPLDPGWYVMAWSIISADGHVAHGTSSFAVGDVDAAGRPGTSALPSPLEWSLWLTRGLSDLMLLVIGGAGIAWTILGARTRRVHRLWIGTVTVDILAIAAWLVIEIVDGGWTWLGTQYAWSAVVRLALLIAIAACLSLRPPRTRPATVLGVITVLLLAWGGHSIDSPLSGVTTAIHLFAAITWLGAAPSVALVVWDRSVPDETGLLVVRGFSRLATVALFVLIAGGSASALLLTNGLEAGLTLYVGIIIAKVGVVGIAALLGAWGRRRLARTPERRIYRRLFLVDSVLLVTVALISSALTLVGPHEGHAGHEGHVLTSPRCSMSLGQGSDAFGAAVVAEPGTPGPNGILVAGVPAGVVDVSAELVHAFTQGAPVDVALTLGDRGWSGSAVMPFTGDWTSTVLVRVDTFTEVRGSCDLTIAP
jgi:methionine-rich copper-binding protein CopC